MADADSENAWATRLASARQQVHQRANDIGEGAGQLQRQVDAASRALWTLIDGAVGEANRALQAAAPDDLLAVQRGEGKGRVTIGRGAEARSLDIMISPRVVDGAVSGGGVLAPNKSRLSIHFALVQDSSGESLRWVVLTTLQPVTPEVIQTIFLYTFGDDPRASLEVADFFASA